MVFLQVPTFAKLIQDFLAFPRRRQAGQFQVGIHHDPDQVAKANSGLPIQLTVGFSGVGLLEIDLGWPEITRGGTSKPLPNATGR